MRGGSRAYEFELANSLKDERSAAAVRPSLCLTCSILTEHTEQIVTFSALHQLAERGLGLLEGKEPESRQRLMEIRNLYAFLEQELPALLERWEKKQIKKA